MSNEYEPLELIGRGSFGQIRKVKRKSDGKVNDKIPELNLLLFFYYQKQKKEKKYKFNSKLLTSNDIDI